MSDPHQGIIQGVTEKESRRTVRAADNKIANIRQLEFLWPFREVGKFDAVVPMRGRIARDGVPFRVRAHPATPKRLAGCVVSVIRDTEFPAFIGPAVSFELELTVDGIAPIVTPKVRPPKDKPPPPASAVKPRTARAKTARPKTAMPALDLDD